MTCGQCGTALPSEATQCPQCGAPVAGPGPAEPLSVPLVGASTIAPPQAPAPTAPSAEPKAAAATFKLDMSRVTKLDRVLGIATAVLLISLFLPWYTYAGFSASGLSAHGYLYLVLVLCLGVLGVLVMEAGWATPPLKLPTDRRNLLFGGTIANLVLVVIAFLFKPGYPGIGWGFGSFVGLIAAVVAITPFVRPGLWNKGPKATP